VGEVRVRRRRIVKVVKFVPPNVEIDVGGGSLFPWALVRFGRRYPTHSARPLLHNITTLSVHLRMYAPRYILTCTRMQ
jgi:hypothetical protein